jgi:hypothetical protein
MAAASWMRISPAEGIACCPNVQVVIISRSAGSSFARDETKG